MNIHENICKIAEHYGLDSQTLQTIEELSELIQVLVKVINRPDKVTMDDIISEIADVEIMLEQIKILTNIYCCEIEKMKQYKVERQLKRIESEES